MYMLEGLQKVQFSAARLIFQCRKQNNISPFLMSLHKLPINDRIEYKHSYLSFFLFMFISYLLVWLTLSVHTQKKFTLFFWQWNFMYP